jgi:lipid A 4'-phosphatase
MISESDSEKSYRRYWLPELIVLGLAGLLTFVFFFDSQWDLFFAKLYWTPNALEGPWSHQSEPLWTFFYHGAPWLTGFLMLGSLVVLGLSSLQVQYRNLRAKAIFVFLVFALGPGLVINAILKPYWGRPRPRQTIELGGQYEYKTFWQPGVGAQGMSFPCGHSSVGNAYGVFFWIFRRSKPRLAYFALFFSLALSLAMGLGRIVAGGHFMSDVIWSAIIVYAVSWWLYYFGLRIPQQEDGALKQGRLIQVGAKVFASQWRRRLGYGLLTLATITSLLVASPFYEKWNYQLTTEQIPQRQFLLSVERGDVELKVDPEQVSAIDIKGLAKGFGFPNVEIWTEEETLADRIEYRIRNKGVFSDFESSTVVSVNPQSLDAFFLKLKQGEYRGPEPESLPKNFQVETP